MNPRHLAGAYRAVTVCLLLLHPKVLPAAVPIESVSPSVPAAKPVAYLPLVASPRAWVDCSQTRFGSMLLYADIGAEITAANVLLYANDQLGVKGMAGTGAPSELARDEWFGRLPGWTRLFLKGTYQQLEPLQESTIVFGMEDMYECFGYGPESAYAAGEEALEPRVWVPRVKELAEAAGKCLVYGPAVRDYELLSEMEGLPDPSAIVQEIAPHVDVWIIQLAKYQNWVDLGHDEDGKPYTLPDLAAWVASWVSWIKGANPEARVWTQMGIGKWDPMLQVCLRPQPPEYILEYREALATAGVDGLWIMPAQPCMPCPPDPMPGFLCSTDAQDNEYYRLSLVVFQQAMGMACGY